MEDQLKKLVERERLKVQEGDGKDGIRSQRRWGKRVRIQMKGLTLKRKENLQPSDIKRLSKLEE